MIRPALWALLAAGLSSPLAAQSGREYFVQPDTAYDSVHTVQRDAFTLLRDSTTAISAATSRLMAGISPSSSLPWLRGQAMAVAAACRGATGPLAAARAVTQQGEWPKEYSRKAQASLLEEMGKFSGQLGACDTEWKGLAADTSQQHFRDNAPYRLKRLNDQVAAFNRSVGHYLRSIGVKLKTPGT